MMDGIQCTPSLGRYHQRWRRKWGSIRSSDVHSISAIGGCMISDSFTRIPATYIATRSVRNEISSSIQRNPRRSYGTEIHCCESEIPNRRCRLCVLQIAARKDVYPRFGNRPRVSQSVVFRGSRNQGNKGNRMSQRCNFCGKPFGLIRHYDSQLKTSVHAKHYCSLLCKEHGEKPPDTQFALPLPDS